MSAFGGKADIIQCFEVENVGSQFPSLRQRT
jgi:hypothetical protein